MQLVRCVLIVGLCVLVILGGRFTAQSQIDPPGWTGTEKMVCLEYWTCQDPTPGAKWICPLDKDTSLQVPCTLDNKSQIRVCVGETEKTCWQRNPAPPAKCLGKWIMPDGKDGGPCTCTWAECSTTGPPP